MPESDSKKNLIRGAMWTVGTRWVIKGLGFINTVIMARLLLPEDYGVVAMAMLVVGLIQTFLDFGPSTALMRKDHVTTSEINSAWTLRMLQGMGAGALLLVVPPFVSNYFDEPRLVSVLWVLAFCVVVSGASNMGVTLANKAFNFKLQFRIETTAKLLSVIATVLGGVYFGDYRALALGIVVGYITPMVTSYLWHPYRPRWDTSGIPEIWAVTKWLLLANIGSFVLRKGDELAAAKIGNTHEYGVYNVGSDFGQMPVMEVGPAMIRALLPVLSTMQNDARRINQAVIKTTAAMSTVIWPLGIGFAALATPATELLLGEKWLEAVPFAMVFAAVSIVQTINAPARTLLTLHGHTKAQNHSVWLEFVCFVLGSLLLVPAVGLIGLAVARLLASVANLLAVLTAARSLCQLRVQDTLRHTMRPMAGALIMGLLVHSVASTFQHTVWQLVVGVAVGVASFSLWTYLTWLAAKKPEGLESTVMDRIRKRA